jgi:hypothetical protein
VVPPAASAVSGALFEVEGSRGLLGIDALRFDFTQPAAGRIRITSSGTGADADWGVDVVYRTDDLVDHRQTVELELGLDGTPRTTIVEHQEIGEIPVSARGHWSTECRLDLTVVTGWAIPQAWTVDFCAADVVNLEIKSIFYSTRVSGRRRDEPGSGSGATLLDDGYPSRSAATGSRREARRAGR